MKIVLQIQDTRMPKLETKVTILEAEKESVIKANVEMKSSLDANEDAIITNWRDVVIKKTPKENSNEVCAPEKRNQNLVIRGMQEEE